MKTLKTKKIFLIAVLFSVGLGGCAIEKEQIELCEKLCEPNGGLAKIQEAPFGFHCFCANGLADTIQ